jgi:hypothetical protein
MINPDTFTIDVSLEIACSDDDQILSRPVGAGYTWEQLVQSHVRFSGDDGDVGAVPNHIRVGELDTTGYCESAEFSLHAFTTEGKQVYLGQYGSESQALKAKEAIADPETAAEIERLEKLAYIGEHQHDDYTYKFRNNELALLCPAYRHPQGCKAKLAAGQWWSFCGETDMGQTAPALCTKCGGTYRLA